MAIPLYGHKLIFYTENNSSSVSTKFEPNVPLNALTSTNDSVDNNDITIDIDDELNIIKPTTKPAKPITNPIQIQESYNVYSNPYDSIGKSMYLRFVTQNDYEDLVNAF